MAFWTVQQTLLLPLLLAGMLLPVDQGPGWLQALSRLNPLTYVVEAERAPFAGDLLAPAVGGGVIAAVAAVGLLVGVRAIRRT